VALVGGTDPLRAGRLHARLGRYMLLAGRRDAAVAAHQRAVELVPPQPPSAERAEVLAALGSVLMLTWRHDESRAICRDALTLARAVGARRATLSALGVLGVDLVYLGHADDGLAALRQALHLAEENGPPDDVYRASTWLTDALNLLGQPREAARLAAEAREVVRPYGIEHGPLTRNHFEALFAVGDWDAADRVSAAALREMTDNWPHNALINRAEIELGRGDFDAARTHLEAALVTVREDERGMRCYDPVVIDLALWEGRWEDADELGRAALERASTRDAALFRVQLCAQGLRAQAELAAPARARRLLSAARGAAEEAVSVTPTAGAWRALAEAEYARARGSAQPDAWFDAAAKWERLERPPLAAYCRWRQAEALTAAHGDPSVPLQEARATAMRIGAKPLLRELELLADRVRPSRRPAAR
jgi:tetratricopeptide (TPR) repeat protein